MRCYSLYSGSDGSNWTNWRIKNCCVTCVFILITVGPVVGLDLSCVQTLLTKTFPVHTLRFFQPWETYYHQIPVRSDTNKTDMLRFKPHSNISINLKWLTIICWYVAKSTEHINTNLCPKTISSRFMWTQSNNYLLLIDRYKQEVFVKDVYMTGPCPYTLMPSDLSSESKNPS